MNLQPMPELLYSNTVWALTTHILGRIALALFTQTSQLVLFCSCTHEFHPLQFTIIILSFLRSLTLSTVLSKYVHHHTIIIHKKVKKIIIKGVKTRLPTILHLFTEQLTTNKRCKRQTFLINSHNHYHITEVGVFLKNGNHSSKTPFCNIQLLFQTTWHKKLKFAKRGTEVGDRTLLGCFSSDVTSGDFKRMLSINLSGQLGLYRKWTNIISIKYL